MTSFHHQPEAQRPKSSNIYNAGPITPSLGEKLTCLRRILISANDPTAESATRRNSAPNPASIRRQRPCSVGLPTSDQSGQCCWQLYAVPVKAECPAICDRPHRSKGGLRDIKTAKIIAESQTAPLTGIYDVCKLKVWRVWLSPRGDGHAY